MIIARSYSLIRVAAAGLFAVGVMRELGLRDLAAQGRQ
jgi:hypothetical protein